MRRPDRAAARHLLPLSLLVACGRDKISGLDVIPCADLDPDRRARKVHFQAPDPDGVPRIFRVDADGAGLCRMGPAFADAPPGAERAPAGSADGLALAFVGEVEAGAGVVRADAFGEDRLLLEDGPLRDPAWDPFGGNVYAVREDEAGDALVRFAAGGGGLVELWTAPGLRLAGPAPSPDGAHLLVEGEDGVDEGIFHLSTAAGAEPEPRLLRAGGGAPAWRGDGGAVVLTLDGGVAVAPWEGEGLGAPVEVPGLGGAGQLLDPCFIGEEVLLSADLLEVLDLWVVRPDGADLRQITAGLGDKRAADCGRVERGG
jgi:hypothetical protein